MLKRLLLLCLSLCLCSPVYSSIKPENPAPIDPKPLQQSDSEKLQSSNQQQAKQTEDKAKESRKARIHARRKIVKNLDRILIFTAVLGLVAVPMFDNGLPNIADGFFDARQAQIKRDSGPQPIQGLYGAYDKKPGQKPYRVLFGSPKYNSNNTVSVIKKVIQDGKTLSEDRGYKVGVAKDQTIRLGWVEDGRNYELYSLTYREGFFSVEQLLLQNGKVTKTEPMIHYRSEPIYLLPHDGNGLGFRIEDVGEGYFELSRAN